MTLPSKNVDQAALQITRGGYSWLGLADPPGTPLSLTYAFRAWDATYVRSPSGPFSVFNSTQIQQALLAVQSWTDVANITLTRVGSGLSGPAAYSNNATILFGNTSVAYAADDPQRFSGLSYLPNGGRGGGNRGSTGPEGDIWVNAFWPYDADPALWNKGQLVLVHELGHAFGLEHPSDYNAMQPSGPPTYASDASYREDDNQYTIMSYFNETNTGADYHGNFISTPMLDDISAIQRLYGANTSTRAGDTVYGFNANADRPWLTATSAGSILICCIWDGGGTDTLDFSGYSNNARIDLQSTHFSDVGGMIGNVSIAQGVVIENAIGGSGADTIVGNEVANVLKGGAGNDTLDGGANIDTAALSGNRSAYVITQTSTGNFTVTGPDGSDALTAIEYLRFDDQTIRLLPGTGSTINWSADPSTYMAGIRDFDGNDMGGAASWKLIGMADVNGDGTSEHVLFNRQIGRWAEVATEADGLTYFSNYSWAGDTRIVGIYIDPLVANGTVVRGSDTDSQKRFQNDLTIDNIHGILNQADYNHDGLQEVYFSLTDGTAYLHAYMHADGNIQYANYQSKQQVIDYLTTNGVSSSTWATWFPASQAAMPTFAALAG